MDKYKLNSSLNKWFSAIELKKLSSNIQEKIKNQDKYCKKLTFTKALRIFLHAINDEKESLRDIDTSFVSTEFQDEIDLKSISYSQLSRTLSKLDPDILRAIYGQLLGKVKNIQPQTKRNSLFLVDSSTFSLNKTNFPWATFRKTKSGIKLHLKLCFMDKEHFYPDDFQFTNAIEHDDHYLQCFVDKAEATYVFDRGYLEYDQLDKMYEEGYFFVTRTKKNSKIIKFEEFALPENSTVVSDQLVALGGKTKLTHRFRLVTILDERGKELNFITNRMDCTADEVANMYKARWQIELFFKHIKQHMTIKTYFSRTEQGVKNQLILTMIACLLNYLIKLETNTKRSIFQIKRVLKNLLFQPFEKWFEQLIPT